MTKDLLKKAYLIAALVSGVITGTILIYALVIEILRRTSVPISPILSGQGAVIVKYAVYIVSIGAVFALKFIKPAMEATQPNAAKGLQKLITLAIVTAAICEVPAIAGFVLFFIGGSYLDFYVLASFAAAMEIINFPKYRNWEDKIRSTYGIPLE